MRAGLWRMRGAGPWGVSWRRVSVRQGRVGEFRRQACGGWALGVRLRRHLAALRRFLCSVVVRIGINRSLEQPTSTFLWAVYEFSVYFFTEGLFRVLNRFPHPLGFLSNNNTWPRCGCSNHNAYKVFLSLNNNSFSVCPVVLLFWVGKQSSNLELSKRFCLLLAFLGAENLGRWLSSLLDRNDSGSLVLLTWVIAFPLHKVFIYLWSRHLRSLTKSVNLGKKMFKHIKYISAGARIINRWWYEPSERGVWEHSKILHCIDIW